MLNHKIQPCRMSQSRRISPCLAFLLFCISFWITGAALADSEGFFSSEEDFLAKADSGWVRIADGVYEKQMTNGETVRHGFGVKGNAFFLESAKSRKEGLLERGPQGNEAAYAKMLSEIERTIDGLEVSLARATARDAEGSSEKAACFGPGVSLTASVSCSPSGGMAQSRVFFSDFGPCHSANAAVTASANPGSFQHQAGPLSCWTQWSATASCNSGSGSCYGYAFASIDFTSCDLYQFREAGRWCNPGGILE